jgi:DNA-directed RNA polymerase alpha subunit
MTMANTEIQFLKKQIKQLHDDMAALIAILIQLKVLKIKIDENGNAIYDAGNDEQSEVQ